MVVFANEKGHDVTMSESKWNSIKITNSLLFKHIMQNEEICKGVLESVLGVKIEKIVYKEVEKELDLSLDAKSVRLDVYVEDQEGVVFDIEMQATDTGELPKRSRYYQGMVDLNLINKGNPYTMLPKSFIIFICPFDQFGKGRSIYTFERTCVEEHSIKSGDELRAFLKYVKTETTESELAKKIAEEAKKIKENRDWRQEYMSLYAHECDLLARGRREGREEGESYNLIKLITQRYRKSTIEEVADFLECDEKLVSKIYEIIESENILDYEKIYKRLTESVQKYAPEYDEEKN